RTGCGAHDFNNLLTVIVGNLELLEMRLDDKNLQELLTEAQEAADMGARLTERLLAFARRSQLEPDIVDLNALVVGLTDMLHRTLGETISLSTALSTDLWTTKVDPGQVESAVLNLAVNARDAMSGGGKIILETRNMEIDELYVAAEAGLVPGDYVQLSVSDTGGGMPYEIRERAFEPFFTTKEPGRGTGLGLSMVYGFAKQSGGHVSIYSEVGKGSCINLYLPRHHEADSPPKRERKESTSGSATGELILAVEDDSRVRRLTLTRLKELGYRVLEAASGPEALGLLTENASVDLVFSDLVMPGGMSGYELCEEARKRRPDIRCLLTSGYAEELVNADKLSQEQLKVLRKPYRQAGLAQAVRNALD
ncbi:MAG: ATP-binding protein, partial [Hyphomicrobiales bacterium]|nr:ATP-binding protein [Hyphomicrobiales bacterium]